jgi:hypothetical protein
MNLGRCSLLVVCMAALSGCSASWHHDYQDVGPKLEITNPLPTHTLIVVRDARVPDPASDSGEAPMPVNGTAIGSVHSPLSSTWQIKTESGKTFADELGIALCRSFSKAGYQCTNKEALSAVDKRSDELQQFVAEAKPNRVLNVVITKWYVDVYSDTEIQHDIGMEVLDPSLKHLSSAASRGRSSPPRATIVNPAENAATVAPLELTRLLTKLLRKKEIQKALLLYSTK